MCLLFGDTTTAFAGSCEQGIVEHVWSVYSKGEPTPKFGDSSYDAYVWCYYPYLDPPDTVYYLNIRTHKYHCATHAYLGYTSNAGCTWRGKPSVMYPEGELESANTCNATCVPPDLACDGLDQDLEGVADEGCLDGESGCPSVDRDEFPYKYATGRVETEPVVLYRAPSPRGVFFGVRLQYGSNLTRTLAVRNSPDTLPMIHGVAQDTHFIGTNWVDNFSDRLIPPVSSGDGLYTWIGNTGTVNFDVSGNGPWTSKSGFYTLRRTGTAAGTRYIVSSKAVDGPVQVWVFDTASIKIGSVTRTIGFLTAYGAPDDVNALTGGYVVSIARSADKRIELITDTLGREIDFVYEPVLSGSVTKAYRVTSITFRNDPSSTPTTIGELSYTAFHPGDPLPGLLDRIELPLEGTYRRFTYFTDVDCGSSCGARLAEVIVPVSPAGASAPPGAAPLSHEAVVEGHEWCAGSECQPGDDFSLYSLIPDVKRTWGPGREWGYERVEDGVYQIDLHQPDLSGTSCASGCSAGYRCWNDTGGCYRYSFTGYNSDWRNVTSNSGSRYPGGSGESYDRDTTTMRLRSTTDGTGIISSYGESPDRSLSCMIVGDDDHDALDATKSDCDPPASGEYHLAKEVRTPTTTTTIRSSIVAAGATATRETTRNTAGLVTAEVETGWTTWVDGTLRQQMRTTSYAYDALGRVIAIDGPRPGSEAYDVTELEYWPDTSADRGRLRYERVFVGTATQHTPLQWEYSNYDAAGTPRTLIAPNGARYDLTSVGPYELEIVLSGPDAPTQTQRIQLNLDGTVRTLRYGSGTCITYEYESPNGHTAAPTKIKRTAVTSADCGIVPIDATRGTVVTFEYAYDEPDRLLAARQYEDGVLARVADGFAYSPDRRLIEASSPHSDLPHVLSYEDGVPVSQWSPGWPATDSWRIDAFADDLGRPQTYGRYVTPVDRIMSRFYFEPSSSPMPTRVTTGLGEAAPRTELYTWDDFGQLVRSSVPEHGTTRWEYDVSGRVVRTMAAVGTPAATTADSTYDSLGRLTRTSHGVEPQDCADLPDGTAIDAIALEYDSCQSPPAGFTCENASTRLASATIFHECRGHAAVYDRRYLAYSATGLLETVAFESNVFGSATQPVLVNYSFAGPDGSMSERGLSIAETSTAYAFDAVGQIAALNDGLGASVITNLAYEASGAITSLQAPGALVMDRSANLDGSPHELRWTRGPQVLLDASFEYYATGMVRKRTDAVDATRSRYYEYDRLLRLTCEARGDASGGPGPSDCVEDTARVLGRFTYGSFDAQAATDGRTTALQRTGAAAPGVVESYSFSPGTMRPLGSISGDVAVDIFTYDTAGRRIRDEAYGVPESIREYSYWPSGRLRRVTGTTTSGAQYAISVTYDPYGHVGSETYSTDGVVAATRAFYWSPDGVLEAVHERRGATDAVWVYHSIGGMPFAVTKESGGIKARFWFVTDERGLVVDVIAEDGTSVHSAQYDAGGWRVTVGGGDSMFMPFGLPGHLMIEESGRDGIGSRVPIAIVGGRPYDPRHQLWLTPDPADREYRVAHEGYSYARANPLALADPTGNDSFTYWRPLVPVAFQPLGPGRTIYIDKSCEDAGVEIANALATAISKIENCTSGACGFPGGQALRRQWLAALSWGEYHCPKKGMRAYARSGQLLGGTYAGPEHEGWVWQDAPDNSSMALNIHRTALGMMDRAVLVSPRAQHESTCGLAGTLAHEAMHTVMGTLAWWEVVGSADARQGIVAGDTKAMWLRPYAERIPGRRSGWSLEDRTGAFDRSPPEGWPSKRHSTRDSDERFADWVTGMCLGCAGYLGGSE
jgi:RHS repeat-associated protein